MCATILEDVITVAIGVVVIVAVTAIVVATVAIGQQGFALAAG